MGDYIIVGCLDSFDGSDIQRIPRHVTLVPWFSIDVTHIGSLESALAQVVMRHAPFVVWGDEEAYFGPDNDVQVRRVKMTNEMTRLHSELLDAVEQTGGSVRRRQYVGDNYQPHVSKQSDGYLDADEEVIVDKIQLVKATGEQQFKRHIVNQYKLEDNYENAT